MLSGKCDSAYIYKICIQRVTQYLMPSSDLNFYKKNQSINQSINQPASQSVSQSVSQSIPVTSFGCVGGVESMTVKTPVKIPFESF